MAVVTGGASGVGLATARLLAARGACVACLDLRPDAMPAPLVDTPADAADDVTVRAAVEEAARWFGGLGILASSAGIGAQGIISPSSAAWADYGFGPAPDLPRETVRRKNQP
ncbi:SDR family NAD(P)-dependent oxidoreductase [Streptomyces jeddahensis]